MPNYEIDHDNFTGSGGRGFFGVKHTDADCISVVLQYARLYGRTEKSDSFEDDVAKCAMMDDEYSPEFMVAKFLASKKLANGVRVTEEPVDVMSVTRGMCR